MAYSGTPEHRKKQAEKMRVWRSKPGNAEKARKATAKWRDENPDKVRAGQIRHYRELRLGVLAAYGNKCACCGETCERFLAIDHIHGGGNQHRKKVFGVHSACGPVFYRWLRNEGYPKDDFQILCHNCNMGKHMNGGVCPHREMIKAMP